MNTPKLTHEQIRAAGGIVHSDGNIFFTNIEKLNDAIAATQAQGAPNKWREFVAEVVASAESYERRTGKKVNAEWVERGRALLTSAPPAPQAKPLAWFDNSGKLHGRVSVEQLEQLCREGIVQMQAIHGIKE